MPRRDAQETPKKKYNYRAKKPNGKNATGAPQAELPDDQDCVIAETAAKLGGTNEEICAALGIGRDMLAKWELRSPDFRVAINNGRDYHSNIEIKRSLRDRAKGYNWTERSVETTEVDLPKVIKLKDGSYAELKDDKGRKITVRVPIVKTKTTTKHVPGDPACIFFWLTNKRKEEFSHVRVNRIEGEVKGAPVTNNYYWGDIPEAELESMLDTLSSAVEKKRQATAAKGNGASGTA